MAAELNASATADMIPLLLYVAPDTALTLDDWELNISLITVPLALLKNGASS